MLWVAIVDTTGKVFNILPNIHNEEQALGALGVVEGGLRRVRVLHRLVDLANDPNLMAMRVDRRGNLWLFAPVLGLTNRL